MKTHEPTSQFRNENIAIDSPLPLGGRSTEPWTPTLHAVSVMPFFFLKFY